MKFNPRVIHNAIRTTIYRLLDPEISKKTKTKKLLRKKKKDTFNALLSATKLVKLFRKYLLLEISIDVHLFPFKETKP
jgi:hypothetical protein